MVWHILMREKDQRSRIVLQHLLAHFFFFGRDLDKHSEHRTERKRELVAIPPFEDRQGNWDALCHSRSDA